jgi:hypothetical protein
VFSDEPQLLLELLHCAREDLADILVNGTLDILAKFNDQLNVPPAILDASLVSSLSTQLDFLFNAVKLRVESIQFALPLGWIYFPLNYLMISLVSSLIRIIISIPILIGVEKVYLGLLSMYSIGNAILL